jgi:FMN phosphatase YigB (HAD superfamily)
MPLSWPGSPEQTLYIGDNYFADVVGARRAGLRPVLYDPKGLFHEPGCPVIASFR